MKKYTINHWTYDEERLLAKLIAKGERPTKCAELLTRHTDDAIRVRVTKLRKDGLIKPHESKEWSEGEIKRLIKLADEGLYPPIDPILLSTRTPAAIRYYCHKLKSEGRIRGIKKPKKLKQRAKPEVPKIPEVPKPAKIVKTPWTDEEDQLIADLVSRGEKPYENETLLSRHNRRAIILHCSRLKTHPTRRRHFYNEYTEEEIQLIIDLLRKGERPQLNPTLLARHSRQAIYVQCSRIRKEGASVSLNKAAATAPTYSVILSSMVTPLQRKAIVGDMFN